MVISVELLQRRIETAGHPRHALGAHLDVVPHVGFGCESFPVYLQALVAPMTVDAFQSDGFYRAGVHTFLAVVTGFMQAEFRLLNQGMIAQRGLGNQAAQPAGTASRGDKLGVQAKTPQAGKMRKMLVGPARRQ